MHGPCSAAASRAASQSRAGGGDALACGDVLCVGGRGGRGETACAATGVDGERSVRDECSEPQREGEMRLCVSPGVCVVND